MNGFATDYVMEIREEVRALAIIYPHFGVRQSSERIMDEEKDDVASNITLNNGRMAKWFENKRKLSW
jgi:hypothetical protein